MTSQLTPEQIAEQEYRYGGNVLWFLNDLASREASDIDADDFEVYGENEHGIEGSASISIVELAADAAKLIAALQSRAESAEQALLLERQKEPDLYLCRVTRNGEELYSPCGKDYARGRGYFAAGVSLQKGGERCL